MVTTITADMILTAKKCGDVFTRGSKDSVTAEYRMLAKEFHPDVCKLKNATDVTCKLNVLYKAAISLIEKGEWEVSNQLEIKDLSGHKYMTRYYTEFTFELGVAYIGDRSVTYIIDVSRKRFFDNAVAMIGGLKYANDSMKKEFSRYLPHIKFNFQMSDGRYCIIVSKSEDMLLLSDVVRYFDGKIPDRHVAWIISRLCSLCCYFDYAGIAHNGLTLQNCFISPKLHTVMPLGGWWYARTQGEPMIGMPREIYDVMPVRAKSDKVSSIHTDLESVKLIGRRLNDMKNEPSQIAAFLNSGSSVRAVDEFNKWSHALDAAYGRRHFVEMNISKSDIYK